MKKILSVQDISCVGQCSLTVAMPIISSFGIETCILPTGILSTHTSGFKGFTFLDMTDEIKKIISHWEKEHLSFDGLYTGYLGSVSQVDEVIDIINKFIPQNNPILCDPAMADNGKLYPLFNDEYVAAMRRLVSVSTMVIPNITEACYLLGIPYMESYNIDDIKNILKSLCDMGPEVSILTGISFEKGKLGIMLYNKTTGLYESYFNEYVNKSFHGTGDIYASCYFGGIIKGLSPIEAGKLAVDFTLDAIKNTINDAETHWYGVHFEPSLKMLK